MSLHLYAVVRAGTEPPPVPGVGEPPSTLSTVVHGDLAVVVSDGADPQALTDSDAVAHFDVLSALVKKTAVLPLRFGTVAPDESAVRDEVLAANHDTYLAMLERLDGLVELRLELAFDEEPVLRELREHDPDVRAMTGSHGIAERIQLGELVADRVTTYCQERGEQLVESLARTAESAARIEQVEPYGDRWALLVRADRMAEMDEQVAALRTAAPDVRIAYMGPIPAVTFLDEIAAHESAPAGRWGW